MVMVMRDVDWVVRKGQHALTRDGGLRAADVVRAEKELPVEVGVVDRVQVDHRDRLEAHQDEVPAQSDNTPQHVWGAHHTARRGGGAYLTSSHPMPPAPTTSTFFPEMSQPVARAVAAARAILAGARKSARAHRVPPESRIWSQAETELSPHACKYSTTPSDVASALPEQLTAGPWVGVLGYSKASRFWGGLLRSQGGVRDDM